MSVPTRIVVLDDDPTGSQTVHSCLLLTRWDPGTLRGALRDSLPIFFVLTNTRAMTRTAAVDVTREVCRNLHAALEGDPELESIHLLIISRSDSTLRGHYPAETDVIAEEFGPFDAHFLVPAFFEGGRFTRAGVHYVTTPSGPVRADETPFSRDSVFGYSTSVMAEYVQEKTGGRTAADEVVRIPRGQDEAQLLRGLLELEGNTCCIVDAQEQADLDRFARACTTAAERGKRFLFRSAASLITSFAGLAPQPIPPEQMHRYVPEGRPGIVIVGSHVPLSTAQLYHLLGARAMSVVEVMVDVASLPADADAVTTAARQSVDGAIQRGLSAVVYTSRTERTFRDSVTRLAFGAAVSRVLMDVVRSLPAGVGFIISKGGITSNDILTTGLALAQVRIVGQILPGCTVVRTPPSHRLGRIPVVIFPGNVGEEDALTRAFDRLTGKSDR